MDKRRIKLIIFDLDGTLVNAYQAVAQSLNYSLKKFGYSTIDHDTIKKSVGWGDKDLISRFVSLEDLSRVLSVYRRCHVKSLKGGTKFLPGAKRILMVLKKKKYQMAIASNRPTRFTQIILNYLKINPFFACVLCADKVKNPKPAGDILKGILKKLSFKPLEALYVGDMTIDVKAGHKAKVKTIAIVTGSSTRREIVPLRPYRIIHRIAAVEKIVESINRQR